MISTRQKNPTREELWSAAMEWVESNFTLVRYIANPYVRYMASGYADIRQEAYLAAFEALESFAGAGFPCDPVHPRFAAFFRVKMRNHCICLAKSGQPVNNFDPETLIEQKSLPIQAPEDRLALEEEEDHQRVMTIRQANLLPGKQREIILWVMEQPYPVSNQDIAARFDICDRYVRQILKWSSATIAARSKLCYPRKDFQCQQSWNSP